MNTEEPFAPENRRLSILAVRKGMEKTAARGRAVDAPEEPKAKPIAPTSLDPIPKPKAD